MPLPGVLVKTLILLAMLSWLCAPALVYGEEVGGPPIRRVQLDFEIYSLATAVKVYRPEVRNETKGVIIAYLKAVDLYGTEPTLPRLALSIELDNTNWRTVNQTMHKSVSDVSAKVSGKIIKGDQIIVIPSWEGSPATIEISSEEALMSAVHYGALNVLISLAEAGINQNRIIDFVLTTGHEEVYRHEGPGPNSKGPHRYAEGDLTRTSKYGDFIAFSVAFQNIAKDLARIGEPLVERCIYSLEKRREWWVQERALLAIANAGYTLQEAGPDLIDSISKVLNQPSRGASPQNRGQDRVVREAAVDALYAIGSAESRDVLRRRLEKESDEDVAFKIRSLLEKGL